MWRSVITIVFVYLIYRPTKVFGALSIGFLAPALVLGVRYLFIVLAGQGKGHVQSVIACSIMIICGIFMAAIGVIAHLQSINRKLLEEVRYREMSRESGAKRP